MNFLKLIAIGLLLAGTTGCPKENAATAEGTNSGTTATTETAETTSAPAEAPPEAGSLPIEATGTVATVDGTEISKDAYNLEVGRLVKMLGGQAPPQMLVGMKDQIVDQLVSKQLIENAIEKANIDIPEADINAEYANFEKQLNMSAPGGAAQYLERVGRTPAEMKEDIKKSLQLKKMLAKDHDIAIPEADVKAYYEKNKVRFDQPARIQASHILLKLEESADEATTKAVEARAVEIAAKAKADGADFAALAREFSEGPTKDRGGDLGFFQQGQMVPAFDTAVWKMKIGEVSDPVRTEFGFHVIKKVAEQEAQSLTYEDAKPMIQVQLEEPKLKAAMGTTLEQLKAAAKIELHTENIKANVSAAPPSLPPGLGHGHPPMGQPGGQPGGQQLKLDQLQ